MYLDYLIKNINPAAAFLSAIFGTGRASVYEAGRRRTNTRAMQQNRRAAGATIALLASAALGGCAGGLGSPPSPPPAAAASPAKSLVRRGWLSPAARTKPLVYVSDNSANAIEIYPAGENDPSPIGQITDGISAPLGNFVDENGTLYVANHGNNTITEYPSGSTTPSVTLSGGISGPISVAADSAGDVAVGEFTNQTILEFPAGGSSPTVTITLLTYPEGLTFDKSRHLYAAWNVSSSGFVGRVSKCERMKSVCVDQGIAEGQSGGLAIDSAGDLVLGDQTNHMINIYAPHTTTPLRTIATAGQSPYKFALDKRDKKLYVADILNGKVEIYNYATGTQFGTISNGLESAWGVSLSPAAKYGP
jgi:DNA-binding beta-propeller fold protein YncE